MYSIIEKMFFFLSNQKLLDACEEQNVDAYTDSVSAQLSVNKMTACSQGS